MEYQRLLIGTHDGFNTRRPAHPLPSCPDLFRASLSTVSAGPGGRTDARNKSGHDEKKT